MCEEVRKSATPKNIAAELMSAVTYAYLNPTEDTADGGGHAQLKLLGIYSYTNSIAYYFVMFALLGVANYGSRTIAAVSASIEKRSKVFGEIYGFQLIMGIVMTAFYAIYLLFICDYEKQISKQKCRRKSGQSSLS